MCRRLAFLVVLSGIAQPADAGTVHVPKDYKTIQLAINSAAAGDTILVAPGVYRESVRLKERVTLKSVGDDAPGKIGFKRAENTVIDGGGADAKGPALIMADGAMLDGFTITRVGLFDQKEYDKHYATQGEKLPDETGAVGVALNFPALAISGVSAVVANSIVCENGQAGIGCVGAAGKRNASSITNNVVFRNMGGGIGIADGAAPTVEGNRCYNNLRGGIGNRNSSALIINNQCFENVRAGIGIREGATPIVRGNKCYKNQRAGIGVRMKGTNPIIEENQCYENLMAGIGCRDGAAPVIRNNTCCKNKMAGIGVRDGASPLVEHNVCCENEMAGIGCRNGAAPVIRNNRCCKNLMAGIGCRDDARPIIEGNECNENRMAGIGARDGAAPVIRNNRCFKNEMAGIGSRLFARSVIVDNECFENQLAGIGTREGAEALIHNNRCYKNVLAGIGTEEGARALIDSNECHDNMLAGIGAKRQAHVTIIGNKCLENGKVAIGIRDGSNAYISENIMTRTGGMPPMVAVGEGSRAVITGNTIRGGGVTGILIEGVALVVGNQMEGNAGKSGSAIWALPKSEITLSSNRTNNYRNLVNNSECRIAVFSNVVSNFKDVAISIKNALGPTPVYGNIALSKNPQDKVVSADVPKNLLADNILKEPGQADVAANLWPLGTTKNAWRPTEKSGEKFVEDGAWKLVATYGKTTTYKLFNKIDDPEGKRDLSAQLEHIAFRLRGLLERQEAATLRSTIREAPK